MEAEELSRREQWAVPMFQDHDTPAQRRNKEIVMETWRAFWNGDIETGLANMAPDIHWWNSGDGPLGANLHGHDDIRQARYRELDFFKKLERTLIAYHASGDFVIMEVRATGALLDGTPYQNEGCVVYELQEAKIVRVRHYIDTKKAVAVRDMLQRSGQL